MYGMSTRIYTRKERAKNTTLYIPGEEVMKRFTVSLLLLVTALVTGSISASQLRITSISTINTLCQTAASGTIQVNVAGGTSPYTVSIIGPTPQQIAGVPGQTLSTLR